MKLLKTLMLGALAVTCIGTASAQTKIYVTGSSAFRSATVNAINTLLTGTGTIVTASDNATLTSANVVTWTGGSVGGTAVTIKASFSGSGSGIQTVAANGASGITVKFLPDTAVAGGTNADPRQATVVGTFEAATPDIGMSDAYQSSTLFNGTFHTVAYQHLTDNIVGIVTFEWVASNGFPTGMNMTPQLAKYLFGSGAIPLALFDGNSGHQNVGVYATGRDPDSGTRIGAFAETGVGINTTVQQYQPTTFVNDTGTNDKITAMQLYPVQTINTISTGVVGNSGESSGSTLRAFLNKTLDSGAANSDGNDFFTSGYLLTYLGVSDANTVLNPAINKPAVALNYNGVAFSTTAVQQGQYTFWGYEHLMYRSNLGTGGDPAVKLTFATNLKNGILGTSAGTLSPNVKFSDMQVSRPGDGGPVGATYF